MMARIIWYITQFTFFAVMACSIILIPMYFVIRESQKMSINRAVVSCPQRWPQRETKAVVINYGVVCLVRVGGKYTPEKNVLVGDE